MNYECKKKVFIQLPSYICGSGAADDIARRARTSRRIFHVVAALAFVHKAGRGYKYGLFRFLFFGSSGLRTWRISVPHSIDWK